MSVRKGTHLEQYSQQTNQISDALLAQAAAQFAAGGKSAVTLLHSVPNPFFVNGEALALAAPTTTVGQLLRPYPQYTSVELAGQGSFASIYHSLQITAKRRFAGAGSLLVAYTNSKLISNTDTLTSWLETSVGAIQDNNNLRGERSLSSQDVPQRLVISYVLDLPFGQGKKVSFQRQRHVEQSGRRLGNRWRDNVPARLSSGVRQRAGQRCDAVWGGFASKCGDRDATKHQPAQLRLGLSGWFNTACFAAPADFTFGNEPRVDPTLRSEGVNNFDFAIFKKTLCRTGRASGP